MHLLNEYISMDIIEKRDARTQDGLDRTDSALVEAKTSHNNTNGVMFYIVKSFSIPNLRMTFSCFD
jgi:hypothetical protein